MTHRVPLRMGRTEARTSTDARFTQSGLRVQSPGARRSRVVIGLCSFASALLLAVGATPAGAVVTKIGGRGYGITPINGDIEASLAAKYQAEHAAAMSVGALAHPYDVGPGGGTQLVNLEVGPVMHAVTTHVIYWDPNKEFTSTTKGIVSGFFGNVAHDSGLPTNVFAVAGQYTDSTGHAAYSSTATTPLSDGEKFPTSACTAPVGGDPGPPYTGCLLDQQLQEGLSKFIAAENLPVGPTQLYFLLLPHKVATCLEEQAEVAMGVFEQACSNNFFCAYHSYIAPGSPSEIIYADVPFSLLDSVDAKGCQNDGNVAIQQPNPDNAGGKNTESRFADVALKFISHEYIEAATDPLVSFETAWVDARGLEIGDKCNGVQGPSSGIGSDPNSFLPILGGTAGEGTLFDQLIDTGHYYLQSEWDNAGKACLMKPLALGAGSFASPAATAGSPAAFTGSATDPYEGLEPTWSFGDGGIGVGVSVSHTYASVGAYTVTMTPRDGLTDSIGTPVTHTVTVAPAAIGGGGGTVPATVTTSTSTAPAITAAIPHSGFPIASAAVNTKTGVVTLTTSVLDRGMLTFVATFPNGKLGAFGSAGKCKKGQIKLAGRCLPVAIVYAKGSKTVPGAGSVSVTLKPTASAMKALKNALRQRRGVPVSIALSFQSSLGGAAVSHTQTVIVKPRR